MTNNIVFLNVSLTQAPTPATLQQTGAFVSFGGTNTAAGTLTLLSSSSSLASLLATPLVLSSLVWSSGTVTATAAAAHGLAIGSTFQLSIQGVIPVGYNGTYLCTATTTTAFTYQLASNPGTETTPGTWTTSSYTDLQAMNTTFWAQGNNTSVNVLELGVQATGAGPTALGTWLSNNQKTVYAFLVPRWFDSASNGAQASFLTLCQSYQSTTAMTYFFVTTTNTTYSAYGNLNKCIYAAIEAPGINTATEFSIAADFWNVISQKPSSTNKVAPLAFRFVYGVTPYPTVGNQTLFANWKAAGVNWKGTGYEGGISTAIIFWGRMMDARPLNYWYSIDWLQINIDLNVTNAVINGSNNPINPLYLSQQGIYRLQAVGAATLSSGITFGLLTGQVVQSELDGPSLATALNAGNFAGQALINAVPFVPYYLANPGDFKTGVYNGFSITCTPNRGFESITFNVNVTDFVA